ncbi:E3 ubiquitin/ISG15 ligase TRIM25-like [Conger conger]|uniref:E3 ubiquitin/ISG15 ligase TRIM25-like n=1 Tax=Conger conger TaxID=82655 RepID=UPI002A5A9D6E|nr:E3 ubiquitin/ISG15 ligase TRIM25-like [Conger conger]
MAEGGGLLNQDQLSCSICLDLLKDPVAIACGHSYCMGCIKGYWDQDDHTGVYSCPQCRQTFTPRPVLNKNTMLAEVVEKLKKTGHQASPPAHCYAGPGDVACDVCTGRKSKAVMSCLVCLASYCETHIQAHYDSPPLKKHKRVKATGNLQEKICSHHDKVLEVYCRTDQQFICYLCTMDGHRGHDTIPAAAERTEKQKQLGATQSKFQQRIQEREKELQDLRQAVHSLKRSAQAAVDDSERIFIEMIRSIARIRSEVKELIRDQEKAEVSRAEGLLERLEQEIAELRRRDAELEQLSHTEDHIHFLQNCQALCAPPEPRCVPITFNQHFSFDVARKSVSELKEQLEDFCRGGLLKITESVREVGILPIPQPADRGDFLQYYSHLTLDPNTVHSKLSLSEGNRQLSRGEQMQPYPDHPERFDYWEQVLCREGLSGRCYWEAEWSGRGDVYIAVSYVGIIRKGWAYDALFGYNKKSWSLCCSHSKCHFYHNQKCTRLPIPPSSRIGVYLDHRAGTLSFYSISDTMTLLHRVQTTFTQPLYPGFYANTAGSTIKLCPNPCSLLQNRKRKAINSCLVCLASYCETHLKLHNELHPGNTHNVINATGRLQDNICHQHEKLLEVYCRSDQQCICYLCTMDEHRGHDTVSAAAERTEKQKQLGATQSKSQQRIQEREKELQDLRQAVQSLKRSAQAAVEDSERIFTEMICSIERRCSEVKELIRDQEKAEVSRAEGLLERLEQEISELRRRDAELEQLSHTEEHIHFLKSCQSLYAPPGPYLPSITVSPHISFEAVRKSVSELKGRMEDVCKGELLKISESVKEVHTVEPRTREDFLQYSCQLTLDPNTVHKQLRLSEGNREVTCVEEIQSHPDYPERFEHWSQVLCREGLSGHCYWEAEWSGGDDDDWVDIAVTYKDIRRKGEGDDASLGCNDKSWALRRSPSSYSFWHNNECTEIPVPSSSRIGVYLDHRAGTLSFYSVSDTMTLLHTVQTTFTQPLYPGFWVYAVGSSVRLCDL